MARACEQAIAMTTERQPHPEGLKPHGRAFALWVFAIFALVAASGTIVLLSIGRSNPPDSVNQMKNPQAATTESILDGLYVYVKHCQSCHGIKGDGNGERAGSLSLAPADLTPDGPVPRESDGMIFWKISEGHRPMPAYKNRLTEPERWDLVNYLRTLKAPSTP